MKKKALSVLAGLGGAMILSGGAEASYLGLTVGDAGIHNVGQGPGAQLPRQVWRVYAVFSDPGDFLTAIAGSPSLGNIQIESRNALNTGPGGQFINPAGGSGSSPYYTAIGTQVEWDTFVTIGQTNWGPLPGSPNETGLSPGFSGLPNSGSFNSNNAGWFTAGPLPVGMAGNGVNLGGGLWGVLIAQLTVNVGNHVAGTVAVAGNNNNSLAGGTTFQTAADQYFNSFPAPGALALLGLAGVVSSRRRRG